MRTLKDMYIEAIIESIYPSRMDSAEAIKLIDILSKSNVSDLNPLFNIAINIIVERKNEEIK
jgi:hypothetical protein